MSGPVSQAGNAVKRSRGHSGEAGGLSGTVVKSQLDGRLSSVVKEIAKLHSEILTAARTSLSKAIRVGELLSRIRASRKGKWLKWIAGSAPFSERTARNYLRCFKCRAMLESASVADLNEAYALLSAPVKESTQRQPTYADKPKVSAQIPDEGNQIGVAPAPVEQTHPGRSRKHKSRNRIMDAISRETLAGELKQSQGGIDKLLTDTLAQISRQLSARWPDFPARLMEYGNALIRQGERLRDGAERRI
jgi:hypothetical protein